MIIIRYLFISLFIQMLLSSCETILFEEDLASTDPYRNFEYLWNECDEKYAYFSLKRVNWNQIRTEYSAKLYPGMSEDSLFSVLGEMLKELKDDHANLISNFSTSFYGVEYQSQDNFDWRIIVDNYISSDYYLTGPFAHNFIGDGKIGYIRLPSFRDPIDQKNLNYLLYRYKDTEGLVLDLRENGGGAIENVFTILSRLTDTKALVNYSVIKSGPGHEEFSEPAPVFIEPYDGIRFTKKVVVLTDRGTYSSGSLLALATKALPNVLLVGDSTGGGLGMPNGGQLPNGWRYRFSITRALNLDKSQDFENGVPPDIAIQFDWSELGKDEILDRAIEELL